LYPRSAEYEHPDRIIGDIPIEPVGGVELDDNGQIVEVICYSTELKGGLQEFIDLMRRELWRINLQDPPSNAPIPVTPSRSQGQSAPPREQK
jgi:hypothetical protein